MYNFTSSIAYRSNLFAIPSNPDRKDSYEEEEEEEEWQKYGAEQLTEENMNNAPASIELLRACQKWQIE